MKLIEVAEIKQGYQFRKKADFISDGEFKVLQMLDVVNNSSFSYLNLQEIKSDKALQKHCLKKNDIVFCTRGMNNYNILIDKNYPNLITVSQFLVIRPFPELVNPAYLSWFLNQPETIAYLNAHRLTSTVPLINKKALEDLKIELPPLSLQHKIAEINTLRTKEKELTTKIESKKEKMINQILRDSIKEIK